MLSEGVATLHIDDIFSLFTPHQGTTNVETNTTNCLMFQGSADYMPNIKCLFIPG